MSTPFEPSNNLKTHFHSVGTEPLHAQIALRFEIYDIDNDSNYLKDAVKWAESQASNLFLPYETNVFNKAISSKEEDWSAAYFHLQTEYLSGNFSKERYLHLIEVRQYLCDKGVEGFAPSTENKSKHPQTESKVSKSTHSHDSSSTPQHDPIPSAVRTAMMIGGVVAALLALIFSIAR